MANPSEGNSELKGFLGLGLHYQTAIRMKFREGKTHQQIADHLSVDPEINVPTSIKTVDAWFGAGGLLEQASYEFTEYLGKVSLREAKRALKRSANVAVSTLIKAMQDGESYDTKIRAANSLLDRLIPKRQIQTDGEGEDDDDLPAELQEKGDSIINGDNPPASEPVAEGAGDGPGEEVPAPVLPEQSQPDTQSS